MRANVAYFISILACLLNYVLAAQRLEKVETVHLPQQESTNNYQLQVRSDSSILPLDVRSIKDWNVADIVLVSDIDGNIHGLRRSTGELLWTLPLDDPLVRISTNNTRNSENVNSNVLWFVEPYQDGTLYYFNPRYGLNKLPTSIKDLVFESPFCLSGDDKIYTGSRKTSLYSFNLYTGEIKSQFGDNERCPNPYIHDPSPQGFTPNHGNTIMMGKTTYELSIHSKANDVVSWNVLYAQWGPNNIDNDLILQNQQSNDGIYFTPFHDKSLLAINKELGTPAWIAKLPLLAVAVFDVFTKTDGSDSVALPHPLKVLNDLQASTDDFSLNNDLCFINKTSNGEEWFAMSYINYPTLIKSAPVSLYQMALYDLSTKPFDAMDDSQMNYINRLKNLELLKPASAAEARHIEEFIRGTHRVHHLSADTLYQPISRFQNLQREKIKQIGDGRSEIPREESERTIPNIIEGIRFSSKQHNSKAVAPQGIEQSQKDVMVLDRTSDLAWALKGHTEPTTKGSLTIIQRVVEDLVVLLLLLGIIMIINKSGKFNLFNTGNEHATEYVETEVEEATLLTAAKEPIPETIVDLKSPEEKEGLSDTLNSDKVFDEKAVKKVTIVTPNDHLENNGSEQAVDSTPAKNQDSSEEADEEVNETSGQDFNTGTKKKRKRGSRGGRRSKGKGITNGDTTNPDIRDSNEGQSLNDNETISTVSLIQSSPEPISTSVKKLHIEKNLVISDKILGYGSHGTVVYEGTFENRPVAVKRMLLDFYDIANHEVGLLQESDDHPNVIRYFCSQSSESEKFLYIALELCRCSLEDVVDKRKFAVQFPLVDMSTVSNVLYQLVGGLHYLHSLKIVHRDLKPQNILVAEAKKVKTKNASLKPDIRLLISDFGLCKKLDADQSSFRATSNHAALGTTGWRAPELLLHGNLLEISPNTVDSSAVDVGDSSATPEMRLTKAIDIFSLGCVFYYVMTGGGHPFGDRYMREANIITGDYDLSRLQKVDRQNFAELSHLISRMIERDPGLRLDTASIMMHPYFWSTAKKLEFLLKVSDRFEIERRDPPSDLLLTLELAAVRVHGGNWHKRFDTEFMDNLGKYRKYFPDKLMDLLRALRNKYHHFNDMPDLLKDQMSPLPEGFYNYFNERFPHLLMEIYFIVEKHLKHEHVFNDFYVHLH